MTIQDRGSNYEVRIEAAEVARFNASFPCSDIPEVECFFQFERKTGDLVDESEHLREVENSSAISALCEYARVYAEYNNERKGPKNMSTTTKQELLAAVSAHKAGRGAWSRGVKAYAVELVEGLNDDADLANEVMLQKELLNGAQSWTEYSEGGCALVYEADIAERLCSPSELKRCKGGERQPNSRETWIDCQARALVQAAALVRRAYRVASVKEGGAE